MSEVCKFWLNFGIQVLLTLATAGAVWAALYGRWFQARFLPPILRMEIANPNGERRLSSFNGEDTEAIWCHVRVKNERRYSPATFVEVRLLAIETIDAAGQPLTTWTGESLLSWRSEARLRKTPLTIGPAYDCDLFVLARNKFLLIHPKADDPHSYSSGCHIFVTLKAFSMESESIPVRVKIDWDGEWPDGTQPMRRHLSFQIVP